jgi:hypothetical protein
VSESIETTVSLPPDLAKEIMNLCRKAENHMSYSVGILEPNCGRWHRLQPPTVPSEVSYMKDTVSLQELLHRNVLELRSRLELGVQLASTVVQLHGTKWLSESWGSEQIFFFVRQDVKRLASDGTWFLDPIIDKPFVRQVIDSSNKSSQAPQASTMVQIADYDKCLFSLGIVLIELWFGRCFLDLKSSPNMQNTNTQIQGDDGDFVAARLLTGRLMDSGESYLLAVLRCLGMSRPGSSRCARRSLEDVTYKSEIHETVVKVLEENLQVCEQFPFKHELADIYPRVIDICECCPRRLTSRFTQKNVGNLIAVAVGRFRRGSLHCRRKIDVLACSFLILK